MGVGGETNAPVAMARDVPLPSVVPRQSDGKPGFGSEVQGSQVPISGIRTQTIIVIPTVETLHSTPVCRYLRPGGKVHDHSAT